ncbi:MAG: TIGR02710 family CRISPR-associated CARF protein [Nitrospira sp.]
MRRTEDRHESLSAIQETVKPEGFYAVLCYSSREMAQDQPVKALVIALTGHAAAAVYTINRLRPDSLCFVLPEGAKALVESEVQPKIEHLPRRWDWVILPEIGEFVGCYQTLARTLPEMLRTWEVQPGELVVDVTGATSAMAGALTLVTMPMSSRIVSLVPAREGQEDDRVDIAGQPFIWTQGNPWDEAASISRREGCELFNRRLFAAAAKLFREVEARVSGGQKPLYRAFGDLADGYDLWERFHYRQAWEKLKAAVKAFEMASLWGGPPGLMSLLPAIKANAGFLERLVLDPAPVKDMQALDLLAHAGRRLHGLHDSEAAMVSLVRALEAFAQRQLFKQYQIKTWDVQPEQLPQALQETCRSCWLEDLDGKYKLPLQAQFRSLAGLGDQMGQAFLREWPTMKPLLDAASHAVLGHGFEPVKAERVQQLYDVVVKLSGVSETSLPRFPMLNV